MSNPENKFNKTAAQSPLKAIIFFLVLTAVLPFYESTRAIMWNSPRGTSSLNVFYTLVLGYAQQAEHWKNAWGWSEFFKKEDDFWAQIKRSPVLFSDALPPTAVNATKAADVLATTYEKVNGNLLANASSIADNVLPPFSSSSIAEQPANPSVSAKMAPPFRFLVLGDSFVAVYGGVGDILEGTLLKFKDTSVLRRGKVSSGLSRPDYFNWEDEARILIAEYQPNVAIIMIGTNDAQSFQTTTREGRLVVYKYGTAIWDQEYRRRVQSFLHIFQENNVAVYWMGLPMMRDQPYRGRIEKLNGLQQTEAAGFPNAVFVSTWLILADGNGNYAAALPDSRGIKQATHVSDGIHLTRFGGAKVVNELFRYLESGLAMESKLAKPIKQ